MSCAILARALHPEITAWLAGHNYLSGAPLTSPGWWANKSEVAQPVFRHFWQICYEKHQVADKCASAQTPSLGKEDNACYRQETTNAVSVQIVLAGPNLPE